MIAFAMRRYIGDPIIAAVLGLAFALTAGQSAMCLALAYRQLTEPEPPPTAPPV
jgi:hypothetical protein